MLKCTKYKGTCSVYCAARIERQSIIYMDQRMQLYFGNTFDLIHTKEITMHEQQDKKPTRCLMCLLFRLPKTKIFLLPACSSRSIEQVQVFATFLAGVQLSAHHVLMLSNVFRFYIYKPRPNNFFFFVKETGGINPYCIYVQKKEKTRVHRSRNKKGDNLVTKDNTKSSNHD